MRHHYQDAKLGTPEPCSSSWLPMRLSSIVKVLSDSVKPISPIRAMVSEGTADQLAVRHEKPFHGLLDCRGWFRGDVEGDHGRKHSDELS
jgi:hypothetical protein